MKKISKICDKCGKEIGDSSELQAKFPVYHVWCNYSGGYSTEIDLCDKCMDGLRMFLTIKVPGAPGTGEANECFS